MTVSGAEARRVGFLALGFAIAYALLGVFHHWSFRTSYDLGIFDQALWHLSRFEQPASTISEFTNILGDHFYPIIGLLAPLYWILPTPEVLIVAQACLVAASLLPVFVFLRRRLPFSPALMLSAAYACFWGIQQVVASDFHEMAFAPLLIATAVLAADGRQWRLLWTACLLLLFVKEDVVPVVVFLGLYLALQGEVKRGALLAAAGLAAFVLIVSVVIPSFTASGQYAYTGGYLDVVRRPWQIPLTMVSPPYKVRTLLLWFTPFLFLPLRSSLSLLLVPLALERFLSASPGHWGTAFHYTAPVAPIVAMSAGDGLARIAAGLRDQVTGRRMTVYVAAFCLLLSSLLPGRQPLWRLFTPSHYTTPFAEAEGYEALALIPPDASVLAQAALLPHLSQRDEIYVLGRHLWPTDYVVTSSEISPWPLDGYGEIAALLNTRREQGYDVVFERNGWTVLRRGDVSPR
jgi:uncharacterized membrane protein